MNRSDLPWRVSSIVTSASQPVARLSLSFGDTDKSMTPKELLDSLVELFPDFRPVWDGPSNCYRNDDGSFTLHGVFAEFTSYFRDRYDSLPSDRLAALGAFVSDCMTSPDANLENAAATCFVENIAGAECHPALSNHLRGEARTYLETWCDHDRTDIE